MGNDTEAGEYKLLGSIAVGGMAEVQFARHRGSGQLVAVKRILKQYADDPMYRRFFEAEVQLSRLVVHPNVVQTLDADVTGAPPYLVMEYIHGRAVNRLLSHMHQQGKRLPLPHSIHIAVEALKGLEAVHGAVDSAGKRLDAVLCDVSPSNIMVSYDGRVKLIDFGIANSKLRFFEQLGTARGKKSYMAPEQLRGQAVDQRADVYSMGVCVVEMLSGRPWHAGRSEFEIEEFVRSGTTARALELLNHLPGELLAVLSRALSVDLDGRFASAGEFAAELAPFARRGSGGVVGTAELSRALGIYAQGPMQEDQRRLEAVLQAQGAEPQEALAPSDVTDATTPLAGVPPRTDKR